MLAETVGSAVVWGSSANVAMTWWRDDKRALIGWPPQDSADPFAGQLAGKVSGDAVEERYMGGSCPSMDYTREKPAPRWSAKSTFGSV